MCASAPTLLPLPVGCLMVALMSTLLLDLSKWSAEATPQQPPVPPTPSVGDGPEGVIHINVVHRHGARTEPIVKGPILNWAFCVLSDSGEVMAVRLGQFLRAFYGQLLPEKYNTSLVVSRTTDFERTIRTGVGVLRGMYNSSMEIPFLFHKSQDDDYMLGFFYSWPSAVIREGYINTFNPTNNQRTLLTINQSDLDALGPILQTTICPAQQTLCALLAEDIGTCRISNQPYVEPLLLRFLEDDRLFTIQSESFAWQYLYNRSDLYWRNVGPYGRLLAKEWIRNARNKLNGTNTAVMDHYSAHDITIYGFFVALGVINATTTNLGLLVPDFTSAVVGELRPHGVEGNASIRIRFARCNQTYVSGFPFEFQEFPVLMGCLRESGETYWAEECPIDDLERFVDQFAPAVTDEVCYADPRDVRATQCDVMGTVPTHSHCLLYRTQCPQAACVSPFVLNRVTYACVLPVSPLSFTPMKASSGVAIASSSFLLGLVVGVFVHLCLRRLKESGPGV